jgi:hypothetical protein
MVGKPRPATLLRGFDRWSGTAAIPLGRARKGGARRSLSAVLHDQAVAVGFDPLVERVA